MASAGPLEENQYSLSRKECARNAIVRVVLALHARGAAAWVRTRTQPTCGRWSRGCGGSGTPADDARSSACGTPRRHVPDGECVRHLCYYVICLRERGHAASASRAYQRTAPLQTSWLSLYISDTSVTIYRAQQLAAFCLKAQDGGSAGLIHTWLFRPPATQHLSLDCLDLR